MEKGKSAILSEKELKWFARWIERFPPADLEVLAKVLWKRRQEQYSQWDKSIISFPHRKKS